jgi:hypothetical protein
MPGRQRPRTGHLRSRLRELLRVTNALVGIDLADRMQAVVVDDHDSRAPARRKVHCRPWSSASCWNGRCSGPVRQAWSRWRGLGPTGHRWRVLDQLAAYPRAAVCVCLQPSATSSRPTMPTETVVASHAGSRLTGIRPLGPLGRRSPSTFAVAIIRWPPTSPPIGDSPPRLANLPRQFMARAAAPDGLGGRIHDRPTQQIRLSSIRESCDTGRHFDQ